MTAVKNDTLTFCLKSSSFVMPSIKYMFFPTPIVGMPVSTPRCDARPNPIIMVISFIMIS